MREALQLSRNIPVVELTEALGPAKLISAMEKAGTLAGAITVKPGRPSFAIQPAASAAQPKE